MKKPYRNRAKKIIEQGCKLRLQLISLGKSKNEVTRFDCEKILEDISTFQNDRQYAKFLLERNGKIQRIIPGVHQKTKDELYSLTEEALFYV